MSTDKEAKKALIATRIREARVMAGLSQAQVARILQLHRPSVSEMEAGNRAVSADELARLAQIFDVSPTWLCGEGEDVADPNDTRLQLAARELKKLKPDDLARLMRILAAMNQEDAP